MLSNAGGWLFLNIQAIFKNVATYSTRRYPFETRFTGKNLQANNPTMKLDIGINSKSMISGTDISHKKGASRKCCICTINARSNN